MCYSLCVSLSCEKGVECISLLTEHLKSHLFKQILNLGLVAVLALFFYPAFDGALKYLGALTPPVDQCVSAAKPS